MSRPVFILSFSLMLWVLLGGCIEEIPPLEQQNTRIGGELVIYGRITDNPGPHKIQVARTSKRNRFPEPIEGALVVVRDDLGQSETCRDEGEGNYWLDSHSVKGEAGRSYYVEVQLPDGKQYRSRPETMQPLMGKDNSSFSFTSSGGINFFINIFAETSLQPSDEPIFLRWTVEECYQLSPTDFPDPWNSIPPPCYVTQPVSTDKVNIFDGRNVKTSLLSSTLLATRYLDFSFLERHYFYVVIASISETSYDYWEKVAKSIEGTGSLFDSPPAPIPGNIFPVDSSSDEVVLGFFEANAVDSTFFYTLISDMPKDILPYCQYEPRKYRRDYPTECLDCLTLPGSSLKLPYFWGR